VCDTLVALGNSTEDGSVIFGKNSDRPRSEVQLITHNPRMQYNKGEDLQCTYITIPQVSETYEILLSQPWWMWGAEMGVNEYNVVIGNEAIHTHEPLSDNGLLGMDLLRLGLERAKTAKGALEVITKLLEKYGQGGGCAYNDTSWMYHNSFLITDPREGYVLETAGDWWVAEKIVDVRSISNNVSIQGKGDLRRKGIIQHAINQGYCKNEDSFDFSYSFSGVKQSKKPSLYTRGGKTTILLNENKGNITPQLMMSFLREHEAGICMHGGFESTGSQISHLTKNDQCSVHWFTGTSLSCLSSYKPYCFPINDQIVLSAGPYKDINSDWFWKKYSTFLRNYEEGSYQSKKSNFLNSIRSMERNILERVKAIQVNECLEDEITFKNQIRALNLKAWNQIKELIKH
jgi:secernin